MPGVEVYAVCTQCPGMRCSVGLPSDTPERLTKREREAVNRHCNPNCPRKEKGIQRWRITRDFSQ